MSSPLKLLQQYNLRAKKKLGQNFLCQSNVAEKIVRFAQLKPSQHAVEIGPGLGIMSKVLAAHAKQVLCIEKDESLIPLLQEECSELDNIRILCNDALTLNYRKHVTPEADHVVIANLPYYISTPLLEVLLQHQDLFSSITLLLQEEVVDRICAPAGSKTYGRLSVWIQSQCDTERGPKISKTSFFPAPKVDSRLVRIVPQAKPMVPQEDQEKFLAFVKICFQTRRKTLGKILATMGHAKGAISSSLASLEASPSIRVEKLSPSQLYALFAALEQTKN